MNLVLPRRPDHEALVGFLAVASLALGGAMDLLSTFFVELPLAVGAAVGLVTGGGVFVVGLRRERIVLRAYLWWNRAARAFGRKATATLTAAWYWIVVRAVTQAGERGTWSSPGAGWSGRGTSTSSHVQDPAREEGDRGRDVGLADFARWALRSRRYWALALLPLFWLLGAVDPQDGGSAASSNIYTLY
jgi:hypothetical protein